MSGITTDSDLLALLKKRLQFACRFQWVYDVQMTKFFTEQWCSKIPAEWRDCLLQVDTEQLNTLPFASCKATWPDSLTSYVTESAELALSRHPLPTVVGGAIKVRRSVAMGMKSKKLHEVSHLAGVVHKLCTSNNCRVVIDIGSGLGYLGHCLCEECDLCVVGLEREGGRVLASRASKVQDSHEESLADDKVKDVTSSCNEDCTSHDSHVIDNWTEQVRKKLELDFSKPFLTSLALTIDESESTITKLKILLAHLLSKGPVGVCMVGLHCCGDLTPLILTLFSALSPSVSCAVVVGCCYHKASSLAPPLSEAMREMVRDIRKTSPGFELGVFALRLATQETRERWCRQSEEEHVDHMTRVAYRAVLEGVCEGRPLPRSALRGLRYSSFLEYTSTVAHNLNDVSLKDKLLDYYQQCKPFSHYIEPFTALQVCMQGVLEGIVLLDRLCYLRECGVKAHSLPIFDPTLSPRNLAIVLNQYNSSDLI